ncbi:MAG: hypothetical protein R3B40_16935 [Polyangiales bacterium]|nr:hypothetical protein [Sandaracinaceae bacterium]
MHDAPRHDDVRATALGAPAAASVDVPSPEATSTDVDSGMPRRGEARAPRGVRWTAWRVLFACTLTVAAVEVIGHFTVQSRVVHQEDWERAASFLATHVADDDGLVVAPEWMSPVARMALGELVTEERVGYSDLAGFTRVFELSARGRRHPDLAGLEAANVTRVGALTIREYALGPSPVLFDLTGHLEAAHVDLVHGDEAQPCAFQRGSLGRGGLGAGPLMPAARFQCERRRPWLYVGRTINEDLTLQPRRCVWQHPAEPGSRVRTTFEDVPLGARLVLYAGLYYEHERMREHGPFDLRVYIDGREAAHMTHRDGDGWKRLEALTGGPDADPTRVGRVQIEVEADDPHLRSVCWSADIRSAVRARTEVAP